MKKLIISIATIMLLFGSCQKSSELTVVEKEQIVQSVKEVSKEFINSFSQVYNDESLDNLLPFYVEDNGQLWQTDPVFMAYNSNVLATTNAEMVKLGESIINPRISTTITVKESFFSVLSIDKVLEVGKWEASMMFKDSTTIDQGQSINTIIWTKQDGTWKIKYFHQSDKGN